MILLALMEAQTNLNYFSYNRSCTTLQVYIKCLALMVSPFKFIQLLAPSIF